MREKKNWTFEEWSRTYDAILELIMKEKGTKYSQMLVDHCWKNYNSNWNRGT